MVIYRGLDKIIVIQREYSTEESYFNKSEFFVQPSIRIVI